MTATVWTFEDRHGEQTSAELLLEWEVRGDPISDNYAPNDIAAGPLFDLWVAGLGRSHGTVPIAWFLAGGGVFEFAPLAVRTTTVERINGPDFLTFYSVPRDPEGNPVNWLELPVADKLWDGEHANKGGFIQSATGWKPSALQPTAPLAALIEARRSRDEYLAAFIK